jgi:histidyl-tRNA synthetase
VPNAGRDERDLFRAPIGTRDVLPPESDRWQALVTTFAQRAGRAGFGLLVTPMFEHLEVVQKLGSSTDVVRKELYDFADKGGRALALRADGTASVVRAFVQNRPVLPWKVWYVAPNFRYERPQKGRYRQHWQVGVEVLGVEDPSVDVEVIALAHAFYQDVGLKRYRLFVNSMGDAASRTRYRDVLLEYWRAHSELLGDELGRAEANPFRILDSKRDDWEEMVERAPQIGEYLSAEAAEQFEAVQEGLQALGIDFEIAPRLVRGLDYYTGTTFEFASDALDAAQNAIGGGGRYDRLAEEMGGPATAGIGFGIGIERVLIACDGESVVDAPTARVDVFVVDAIGGTEALVLVEELRANGVRADRAYGGRAFRKQMEAANKSGARYAVILGEKERAAGNVAVRDLETGEQTEIHRDHAAPWLTTRLDDRAP